MKKPPDSSYWKSRAAQAQKIYDDDVDLAELQMQSVLKGVKDEAELALRRHSEKFGLDYSENQQFLTPAELVEHRRSFVDMSRGVTGYDTELNALSMKIQTSRQNAIVQQMEVFAAKLSDGHLRVATAAMSDTGEFAQMFSQFSVETGFETKVNWDSASPNQLIAMMQTQREENFYSDRLWANREKLVGVLNTEIAQGMIQGLSAKEMADRIAGQMGSSTSSAMRIVRTETTAISTLAESLTYAQIGITEYEYLATLDSRTSSICQGMDGHVIPLVDLDIGTNAPPLHPNCRSTTIPVVPDDEFSIPAERAARDEDGDTVYIPADMSYDDWEKARGQEDFNPLTPYQAADQPTTPPPNVPAPTVPDYRPPTDDRVPSIKDLTEALDKKSTFDFRTTDQFLLDQLITEVPKMTSGITDNQFVVAPEYSVMFEDILSLDRSSSFFTEGPEGPRLQMMDEPHGRRSSVRASVSSEASSIESSDPSIVRVVQEFKDVSGRTISDTVAARYLGYDIVVDRWGNRLIINPGVLTIDSTVVSRGKSVEISESDYETIKEIGTLRSRMMDQERIGQNQTPTEEQKRAITAYTDDGNTMPEKYRSSLHEFLEQSSSDDIVLRRSQDVPTDISPGTRLSTSGFISTSASVDESVSVAVGAQDPAVLYIRTPAGSEVASIYPYQNQGLRFAGEVLVNENYEMVVDRTYRRSDGTLVIITDLESTPSGDLSVQAITAYTDDGSVFYDAEWDAGFKTVAPLTRKPEMTAQDIRLSQPSQWTDSDLEPIYQAPTTPGINGYEPLRPALDRQGYGVPQVVPEDVFDAVDTGPLYRGLALKDVPIQDMLNNFHSDSDYYIGSGIYGNGWYFTNKHDIAKVYAGWSGVVSEAKLAPTARIFRAGVVDSAEDILNMPEFAWTKAAKYAGTPVASDPSVAATMMGYDALFVQEFWDGKISDFTIILNRGALLMKEGPK